MKAEALLFTPPPNQAAIYIYVPPDTSPGADGTFYCGIFFDPQASLQGTLISLPKGVDDSSANIGHFFHPSFVSSGQFIYGLIDPGEHVFWAASPPNGAYAELYATLSFNAEPGQSYFVEMSGENYRGLNKLLRLTRDLEPSNVSLRLIDESVGRAAVKVSRLVTFSWFQMGMRFSLRNPPRTSSN